MSDESPDLGSSLNKMSPKQNVENQFSDLEVSNDTSAINTRNFLCCLHGFFLIVKLQQHYMLNMHFQFVHFRGMRSEIKLWCTVIH